MKLTSSIRSIRTLIIATLAAASTTVAVAQTNVIDPLRRAGDREFTIGGSGASNTDFNDSFGGANLSYGWYTNETQAWVLRQSINYSNPRVGATAWNGSTRIAFDQHLLGRGSMRPFIGANAGRVYGDGVRDTWAAGLEVGAKFYVQTRTFVYTMAEYGWFFKRARDVDNRFRDGQFNWSLGLGFNF
jgi:hypothetical protein